jgi:hypothetical protein
MSKANDASLAPAEYEVFDSSIRAFKSHWAFDETHRWLLSLARFVQYRVNLMARFEFDQNLDKGPEDKPDIVCVGERLTHEIMILSRRISKTKLTELDFGIDTSNLPTGASREIQTKNLSSNLPIFNTKDLVPRILIQPLAEGHTDDQNDLDSFIKDILFLNFEGIYSIEKDNLILYLSKSKSGDKLWIEFSRSVRRSNMKDLIQNCLYPIYLFHILGFDDDHQRSKLPRLKLCAFTNEILRQDIRAGAKFLNETTKNKYHAALKDLDSWETACLPCWQIESKDRAELLPRIDLEAAIDPVTGWPKSENGDVGKMIFFRKRINLEKIPATAHK